MVTHVLAISPKSVGIAILLTVLLGPLGMLYSTVGGAVIMLIISVLLGIFTFGLSLFITWPICIIWSAIAADFYNRRLESSLRVE